MVNLGLGRVWHVMVWQPQIYSLFTKKQTIKKPIAFQIYFPHWTFYMQLLKLTKYKMSERKCILYCLSNTLLDKDECNSSLKGVRSCRFVKESCSRVRGIKYHNSSETVLFVGLGKQCLIYIKINIFFKMWLAVLWICGLIARCIKRSPAVYLSHLFLTFMPGIW